LGVPAYFSRSHALAIFLFCKTLVVYVNTATVTAKLNILLFNHRPAPEVPWTECENTDGLTGK